MDDPSVLDAFLDSRMVPLTTKRRLACLNRAVRQVVRTYFDGELKVVHVHLTDCTLDNVDFLLHDLFPKNQNLVLCSHRERYMPELKLAEIVRKTCHENPGWRWDLCNDRARMNYATAYFFGHLLVGHCLDASPGVNSTSDQKVYLTDHYDCGLYRRVALNGYDADRAVLHATMLRAATEAAYQNYAVHEGVDRDHILLKSMGLNWDSIRKIAPALHHSVQHHVVSQLALDHNPVAERGARALFGRGVTWTDLTHLSLNGTRISSDGCAWLFSAINNGFLPKLSNLHLNEVDMDDDGAARMWEVLPKLRNLQLLDISKNFIGYDGLEPLLVRPPCADWFPHLAKLDMANMLQANLELPEAVQADRLMSRVMLEGCFPSLCKATFPESWAGAREALSLLNNERATSWQRMRVAGWLSRDNGETYLASALAPVQPCDSCEA